MANQEHLHILQQGAAAWNQWRKEHLHMPPNLSEADLHGMDLHDANLRNSNFFRADLHETDLSRANLHGANLFGSNLSKGSATDL